MFAFALICRKNVKLPYILDLVSDNVRTRILFPLMSLAMFILVIFALESLFEIVLIKLSNKF